MTIIRERPAPAALAVVALLFGGAAGIEAEEVAAPPAPQPAQTQVVPVPDSPRLLADDAERLMRRLIEEALAAKPAAAAEAGREAERRPDEQRVIEVPLAELANATPFFLFEDVTGRVPAQPQLTLEQRRAVVEAFRQAIARERAKPAELRRADSEETRPER